MPPTAPAAGRTESRRILLLRAVNVGGATLPMAELRAIAADLGATDVSTYIASGNLLCTVPGDPEAFDRALERAVTERFGFFREVISRTRGELAAALAAYPFEVADPKLGYVHALPATPPAAGVAALAATDLGDDRWQLVGRDVHLHYPHGLARSPLTSALLARHLGVQGTARNLRTLATLVELAG